MKIRYMLLLTLFVTTALSNTSVLGMSEDEISPPLSPRIKIAQEEFKGDLKKTRGIYTAVRKSGNKASPPELVTFLLGQEGCDLHSLPAAARASLITDVSLDFDLLGKQYRAAKKLGNSAPNNILTEYLLREAGFGDEWDKLSSTKKAGITAVVSVDPLVLRTQYLNARTAGNKASADELVEYLIDQANFKGWGDLSHSMRAAIVAETSLDFYTLRQQYQTARAAGNGAPKEELTKFLFEQAGFEKWGDLSLPYKQKLIDVMERPLSKSESDDADRVIKKMFGGRTSDDIGKNVDHEFKKTVKSVQRFVTGK